ncbi:MAG: hypothetical protein HFJ65_03795 [Eggerthellaceae bacterium]|nr:hypothetical protein [Eggerthellaceae bacterium]
MSFRVNLHFNDGSIVEDDELFDNKEAAFEYGEYLAGCSSLGNEILNMSNPGDYPLDEDEDVEIEVVEAE